MEKVDLHVSSIASALRCPASLEYKLLQTERKPMSAEAFAGSAYHKGLATNFIQKVSTQHDLQITDVCDAFSDAFDSQEVDTAEEDKVERVEVLWEGVNKGSLKDIGIYLTTKYMLSFAPAMKPKAAERRIRRQVDGSKYVDAVVGRLDLEPDMLGVVGVDHKLVGPQSNLRRATTSIQALGYEWLKEESGEYHFHLAVKSKQPDVELSKIRYNDSQLIRFEQRTLQPLIKMIDSGLFPTNEEGWHCSEQYCGYYHLCQGS